MSSFYHSTRSHAQLVTSKQAILKGIAPDGGLYVSDSLPDFTIDLSRVCAQNYQDNAHMVLSTLLDDFSKDELRNCVEAAYSTNFDTSSIVPLSSIGADHLLELYHGPTCAFKDVALQILPHFMVQARPANAPRPMVVTATSGDTGKAALDGFANVAETAVCVFYPAGKVSDVQRLQMVTQEGNNVAVCAVRGNFDDAQSEVKRIFADSALEERLFQDKVVLSSANSINVGRLVPQIVYYFDAYAQLVRAERIAVGQAVEFCVPTGNFGDVLAGFYAKLLGLPVERLIVASNSNDVLVDFITTGVYDRRRPFKKTISPSMDILVSSNLERLLYYLSEGDSELVTHLMGKLADEGCYTVPKALLNKIQNCFVAGRADDNQTRSAIQHTWREEGRLIDTHTAVGKHVLSQLEAGQAPRVLLATASPFKFPADVLAALGEATSGLDGFACMDALAQLTDLEAPSALSSLREKEELHHTEVDVADMGKFVERAAKDLLS